MDEFQAASDAVNRESKRSPDAVDFLSCVQEYSVTQRRHEQHSKGNI